MLKTVSTLLSITAIYTQIFHIIKSGRRLLCSTAQNTILLLYWFKCVWNVVQLSKCWLGVTSNCVRRSCLYLYLYYIECTVHAFLYIIYYLSFVIAIPCLVYENHRMATRIKELSVKLVQCSFIFDVGVLTPTTINNLHWSLVGHRCFQ